MVRRLIVFAVLAAVLGATGCSSSTSASKGPPPPGPGAGKQPKHGGVMAPDTTTGAAPK
jgi:hypothetical protein